jgi:hypothetical protein
MANTDNSAPGMELQDREEQPQPNAETMQKASTGYSS